MAIQDDVKANVMALLNASAITVDGEMTIFGMVIQEALIEYGVSIGYIYMEEMIDDNIDDADDKNKIVACLTDMTMLRVWATLAGISIPTHFNFKIGDNTISKNVHPMIEMNLKMYSESVEKWIKILLSDSWTHMEPQSDLSWRNPIYSEDRGHSLVSLDACNI